MTLPLFGRILSTSDFGIYNTYIAYQAIMSAILGLGFYSTIKNAKLDFPEDFDSYISSILTLNLFIFVLLLILSNLFYPLYYKVIGFDKSIINIMLLHSFGSFIVYLYGVKLNVEFKYKSYLMISFFNTFTNVAFSIVLILFVFPNRKYIGRIIGSALPLILLGLILIVYIYTKGRRYIKKKYWIYALTIGLPLVPHVLSQSLLTQFDRIMIQNYVGDSEAGIYSFIYTICTILSVVQASFNNAWIPWLYLGLKAGKINKIKNTARDYILLISLLTIGFMSVMPEVTKLFANKDYWEGIDLIVPLTLSMYFIFLYSLPVNIEYYNKKTSYISIGTLCAAGANIIFNIFAIKIFGYKAAAYTTLFSYILLFISHWIISKRFKEREVYEFKYILKNVLMVFIAAFTILLTKSFVVIQFIMRYILVLAIIGYIFKNKEKILNIIKK